MNKKIRGTKQTVVDNIKFKSLFESSCYKKLKASGLNFSYETEKIVLWEGFKPSSIVVYIPNKINGKLTKDLCIQNRSLINITYTPDFIVIKDDYKIYFDAKGKENDTYPIKRKMFLKYLENKKDGYKYMFFEPHSAKQMLDAIDIIKAL
jgi:hypothetical protein